MSSGSPFSKSAKASKTNYMLLDSSIAVLIEGEKWQKAFRLREGKWEYTDVADAAYYGRIQNWSEEQLATLPPLPDLD